MSQTSPPPHPSQKGRHDDLRWNETRAERLAWARGIMRTEHDVLTEDSAPDDIRRMIFTMLSGEDFLPVLPQDHAATALLERPEDLDRDVRVGIGDAFQSAGEYELKGRIQAFADEYWTLTTEQRRARFAAVAVAPRYFVRLGLWLDELAKWLASPTPCADDARTDLVLHDLLKIVVAHPAQRGRFEREAFQRWNALRPTLFELPPALNVLELAQPRLCEPLRDYRLMFDPNAKKRRKGAFIGADYGTSPAKYAWDSPTETTPKPTPTIHQESNGWDIAFKCIGAMIAFSFFLIFNFNRSSAPKKSVAPYMKHVNPPRINPLQPQSETTPQEKAIFGNPRRPSKNSPTPVAPQPFGETEASRRARERIQEGFQRNPHGFPPPNNSPYSPNRPPR